jgi:hypothetical protein
LAYKERAGAPRLRELFANITMEGTMNLVRRSGPPMAIYRPRSVEDQFGRMVESIFQDLIAPVAQAAAMSRLSDDSTMSPRVDVSESEKAYTVKADVHLRSRTASASGRSGGRQRFERSLPNAPCAVPAQLCCTEIDEGPPRA